MTYLSSWIKFDINNKLYLFLMPYLILKHWTYHQNMQNYVIHDEIHFHHLLVSTWILHFHYSLFLDHFSRSFIYFAHYSLSFFYISTSHYSLFFIYFGYFSLFFIFSPFYSVFVNPIFFILTPSRPSKISLKGH